MGKCFWVFKVPDPQAPAWRHAQIWALKLEFPEIAQNHYCGALLFRLGLLSIRILSLLESNKNDRVRKNDPNLPITSPNLNIFK